MSQVSTRDVQRLLLKAGYYKGSVDGDLGPKTSAAILQLLANRVTDLAF